MLWLPVLWIELGVEWTIVEGTFLQYRLYFSKMKWSTVLFRSDLVRLCTGACTRKP